MIAAAGAVLLATAAAAAPAPMAGNSKAPVDITSDHAVSYNNDCIAVWTGNAEALQDNARLRADVMTAYMEKSGSSAGGGSPASAACGDLLRLEATGSVYYVTPDEKVHGDKAIYVAADDTITVLGDVVAVRGQNVLRGDRMVINNKTGEGHMEGNATGRNKADRPRGIFYPKQSATPGQPKTAGSRTTSAAKAAKPAKTARPASVAASSGAPAPSDAAASEPVDR